MLVLVKRFCALSDARLIAINPKAPTSFAGASVPMVFPYEDNRTRLTIVGDSWICRDLFARR
jgi:hypothetical protein